MLWQARVFWLKPNENTKKHKKVEVFRDSPEYTTPEELMAWLEATAYFTAPHMMTVYRGDMSQGMARTGENQWTVGAGFPYDVDSAIDPKAEHHFEHKYLLLHHLRRSL